MTPLSGRHTAALAQHSADAVLRVMRSQRQRAANPELVKAFNGATDELARVGELGLTVAVQRLQLVDDNDLFGSGEVYVIGSTLDGTGVASELRTRLFEGIDSGDELPLGDGGMLIAYRKNPRWFLDLHLVVMESDQDLRDLGGTIERARRAAKLPEVSEGLAALSVADPTKITLAVKAVDVFLRALTFFLEEDGDDHVGTIHDFFLLQQAFGAGLHPADGSLRRHQDVLASYRIDLTPLGGASASGAGSLSA